MAEFRPRALLGHLTAHGVDFVVIGGIAATLYGSERDTFDLDVCPQQTVANLDALGKALVEIDARLRGIEEDIPFVPDRRTLQGMELLTLDTTFGPLDILMRPDGSPPYAALRRRSAQMDIGAASVLVCSIDDLIEMKRCAGRGKDLEDVDRLEAIKRLGRRLARSRS